MGLVCAARRSTSARLPTDTYVVAVQTDHIVPWQGCYTSTRLLGGQAEFILSESGHIQSIVAAPGDARARYLTNSSYPADPAAWLAGAVEHRASWWDAFVAWLGPRSGELRSAATTLGSQAYHVLGDAPGTSLSEASGRVPAARRAACAARRRRCAVCLKIS